MARHGRALGDAAVRCGAFIVQRAPGPAELRQIEIEEELEERSFLLQRALYEVVAERHGAESLDFAIGTPDRPIVLRLGGREWAGRSFVEVLAAALVLPGDPGA